MYCTCWNTVFFVLASYVGGVLHPFTWTVGGKKEPLPAVLFSWVIVQVCMVALHVQKGNILIHSALLAMCRILAYISFHTLPIMVHLHVLGHVINRMADRFCSVLLLLKYSILHVHTDIYMYHAHSGLYL